MYFDLTEYTDFLLKSSNVEICRNVYLYQEYFEPFDPVLKENVFGYYPYKIKLDPNLKFKLPPNIDFSFGYDEFLRLILCDEAISFRLVLRKNEIELIVNTQYSPNLNGFISDYNPKDIFSLCSLTVYNLIKMYTEAKEKYPGFDIHTAVNQDNRIFRAPSIQKRLKKLNFNLLEKQKRINEEIFKG